MRPANPHRSVSLRRVRAAFSYASVVSANTPPVFGVFVVIRLATLARVLLGATPVYTGILTSLNAAACAWLIRVTGWSTPARAN